MLTVKRVRPSPDSKKGVLSISRAVLHACPAVIPVLRLGIRALKRSIQGSAGAPTQLPNRFFTCRCPAAGATRLRPVDTSTEANTHKRVRGVSGHVCATCSAVATFCVGFRLTSASQLVGSVAFLCLYDPRSTCHAKAYSPSAGPLILEVTSSGLGREGFSSFAKHPPICCS